MGNEFVVDGAGEIVGKGDRENEACCGDAAGGEIGVLAALLHPEELTGSFFRRIDQCEKVKAQAAEIRQRIGPAEQVFSSVFQETCIHRGQ